MFRTEIHIPKSPQQIHLKDEIISMGSCFSETIGSRLQDYKFSILRNPFGTVFNPLSLSKLISSSIEGQKVSEEELIQNSEVYYHFDLHSDFSDTTASGLISKINKQRVQVGEKLRNAKWLILTLGTAWVYELKENNKLVSNCHKVPSEHFNKRMLSIEEVCSNLDQTLKQLWSINPSLHVLFTLSPVRHSRDGMEANQLSKSTLRLAIQELVDKNDQVLYFPAYELLLDDLRDYRFYDTDLVHPSEEAISYIWDKFIECYIEKESLLFVHKWKKIMAALNHKAFHPSTQAHQDFLGKLLKELETLSSIVDLRKEMDQIRKQLADG